MPATFTHSPAETERKEPGIGGRPPVDRRPTGGGGGGGDDDWRNERRGPRELLHRIRFFVFFVNAAAFSYWLAHPTAATHAMGGVGLPVDLTLEPGHATAALFGLSGDSMVDWAAAKVPFLQKEIPAVQQ